MKAGELLNADMATIGRLLGDGWRWWIDELASLVPARARRLFAGRALPRAVQLADGRFSVDAPARAAPLPVELLLTPRALLTRTEVLPRMSGRDARALLLNDIDRLTPYPAEQVFGDVVLAERNDGGIDATLAVLPRTAAVTALAAARAQGLAPQRLRISGHEAFDFAPAMRAAGLEIGTAPRPAWLWPLVAMLALANVGALVWRDVRHTQAMRDVRTEMQAQVDLVTAVRSRVEAEQARRAALIRARSEGDPLRLLDAVSQTLPDGAWVQRYSATPRTLRLAGFASPGLDVRGALRRTPGTARWRSSNAELSSASETAQPFDLQADVVRMAGPT